MQNLAGLSPVVLGLFAATIGLLLFGVLGSGLARFGLAWWQASLVLFASLAGSPINIPLGVVQSQPSSFVGRHSHYLATHAFATPSTTVAINVGGAVIPIIICIYLILRFPRAIPIALAATVAVAAIVHMVAQPIAGVGIETPALLPPVVAAGATLLLSAVFGSGPQNRFACAYISGTLGTLIGADILNLGVVSSLGGGTASIGGAGTFDGVFLSGLLAVMLLLDPFSNRPPAANAEPSAPPDDGAQTLAFSH